MNKIYIFIFSAFLSATLFLSATSLPAMAVMTNNEHTALAKKMLNNHIRPGYERLFISSKRLQTQVQKLCAVPSKAQKTLVDDAFFGALKSFGRVEHIRFGAMTEHNHKDRLVFWPDRKSTGLKQIKRTLSNQDKSVLDLKSLQSKSVALQGLTAMEYILFGKGKENLTAKGADGVFRCAYAKTVSDNIASISNKIKQGWSDQSPYTKAFLHPSSKSEIYMSPKETTRALFLSLLTGFKLVKDFKIKAPLGKTLEKARPWSAAFWRSGQAFNMMASNLLGIHEMLEQGGFSKIADGAESGIATSVAFELSYVSDTILSFKKPIKQVVTDKVEREKLEALLPALGNVYDNIGGAIAKASDMTAGFNALDGD